MYYIQETDKPSKLFKFFNIIKLEDDKIILPIADEEISFEQSKKLAIKTKRILDKTFCNKVIVSNKIEKQKQYINWLNSYNLNIVDGIWLFELLSIKVLDYIVTKKSLKKEEIQLSILVNDLSEIMLEEIKKIVSQYKRINIVTNHIEKFKKIEEELLSDKGIMITVANNKRKSLTKSELILNVDFPKELINEYKIYENAVMVNIRNDVKIKDKRFNGLCINDYEIKFKNNLDSDYDYEKIGKYKNKYIYESEVYKNQPVKDLLKKIERDKVEITRLIANNISF